eukprot:CAMPEP_0195112446 /NCGR_PEP_ID=MMETSP0448-20130528/99130_1 /TAXON_ID=66468 /ORGANISM="Heterocapsa triquestra, Strain CCMP 448" /LENGTH=501 /DNA_ID=CAMNT_0040149297 /DNA_START=4 /DNA_END=1509 /DNA_ORIENTATION=+
MTEELSKLLTGSKRMRAGLTEPLMWTPKGTVRRLYLPSKAVQPHGNFINIGDGKGDTYTSPSSPSSSSSRGQISLAKQIFPPFLVAGLGMVAAGILLSKVKNWDVFVEVRELMILVPALLGLKGNLEMTLASRLSTHANLGDLDGDGDQVRKIIVSNLAVVQCQAIIVGALAACVAFWFEVSTIGTFDLIHAQILMTSAITAASTASLVLSIAMTGIVIAARKAGVDPDNVAGPIAGMLGDFCTLGLLAAISEGYWSIHEEFMWLLNLIVLCYLVLAAVMAMTGRVHPSTGRVLVEGWKPVILSMLISSLGGVILRHAVAKFNYFSPFAPVMNGAGGNLAAVQSARLCTDLHAKGQPGVMPTSKMDTVDEDEPLTPSGTFRALMSRTNDHSATARVLILLAIPGALVFVSLIVCIKSQGQHLPEPAFALIYTCATIFQVCCLLVLAHGIVGNLWIGFVNPDNAAIPYVTSAGDVIGTSCLTLAFIVCDVLGVHPFPGAAIT